MISSCIEVHVRMRIAYKSCLQWQNHVCLHWQILVPTTSSEYLDCLHFPYRPS